MDISLLNTFLELNRTRHFGKAAAALFLTQSAVSARLKQLEDNLGVKLFSRDRNNVHLTPAGVRFLLHAENIVNTWNRARQETALQDETKILLSIGGVHSLWDMGLPNWIHYIFRKQQDIALQVEAHGQEALLRQLLDGILDIGILFEAPQRQELVVEEVDTLLLMMISSHFDLNCQTALARNDYVMIDWGTAFRTAHARHFPDMPPPLVRMGMGRLGLAFLLDCGGTAYLADSMVSEYLQKDALFLVSDAPVIEKKVYFAYNQLCTKIDVVEKILSYLKTQKFLTPAHELHNLPKTITKQ